MNEKNRTHLFRPCAATALLNELSMENSRARSSPSNDEAFGELIHTPGTRRCVAVRGGKDPVFDCAPTGELAARSRTFAVCHGLAPLRPTSTGPVVYPLTFVTGTAIKLDTSMRTRLRSGVRSVIVR